VKKFLLGLPDPLSNTPVLACCLLARAGSAYRRSSQRPINLDEEDRQAHPPLDQWPGLFGHSHITFAMCAEERNYELFYLSKNILLKDRFLLELAQG
jgi:hypothetical protein